MAEFKRQRIETTKLPVAAREKWGAPILNEGFVPFPKRLVRCLGKVMQGPDALDELSVILAAIDYKRPNLEREYPSVDYLAFLSGLPVERFKKVVGGLQDRGYITAEGNDRALNIEIGGLLNKVLKETAEDVWPTQTVGD